jgi:AraC family ethanolamine operon transcriptional activator
MNNDTVRDLRFSHGEEALAAIRGLDVHLSVLAPSTATWRLMEARIGESTLMSGETGAALSGVGAIDPDALWFAVPIAGAGRWTINGEPFHAHSIASLCEGAEHATFMSAPMRWASLRMPRDSFERKARERRNPSIPRGLAFFEHGESGLNPFRSAVEAAVRFMEANPRALREPEVGARLENALLDSLTDALAKPRASQPSRSATVTARIGGHLYAHRDEMLSASHLCEALSISERTLRRHFEAAFNLSPARFLRLRRLNQAHRALRTGAFSSVTEAGIRFGFFDLGRFAADYRELFGEFPSQTLSRVIRGDNS